MAPNKPAKDSGTIDQDQLDAAKNAADNLSEPQVNKARAAILDSAAGVMPKAVNDDEEMREYTIQHSLVHLPNGKYVNAGDTVSSDDLRGPQHDLRGNEISDDLRNESEQRYIDVGAVALTKTLTRRAAQLQKQRDDAAKAAAKAAPVGTATPDEVRLGLGNVATQQISNLPAGEGPIQKQ